MGMTVAHGPPADEARSIATIRRAYELGVTLFDTAELYGLGVGSNERLLGRAVQGFREDVLLATKFGYDLQDPATLGVALDSRPAHIREVTESSLRHLGTDHIDVLHQHRVDPNVPIEDVAGAVAELIAEGKVRYFGLSEAGPDSFVPYSPLGRGFLAGAAKPAADYPADDMRGGFDRWQPGNYEKNLRSSSMPGRAGRSPRGPGCSPRCT
ncbi:hypothetical protein GBW32_20510 [Streptomyces tsukubensis]|nr:hypothetical protein GBW32_20510 [Streptomyces tsukubensis]